MMNIKERLSKTLECRSVPVTKTVLQLIKHRNMMVILDQLSAQYLTAKMLETRQSPTEIISKLIRREIGIEKTA